MSRWAERSVGLEAEYVVRLNEQPIDSRRWFPRLARTAEHFGFRREAVGRLRSAEGNVITCDGWCIEVATPPATGTDAGVQAITTLYQAQQAVRRIAHAALGQGDGRVRLEGYSLHMNVGAGPSPEDRTRELALILGPLFIFLTDRSRDGGVVLRPRPGRLELVSRFLDDPDLLRAVVAALLASQRVDLRRLSRWRLPETMLLSPKHRYGFHLFPEVVDGSFAEQGRAAPMAHCGDGTSTFQTYLDDACAALTARGEVGDLDLLRDIGRGDRWAGMEDPRQNPPPLLTPPGESIDVPQPLAGLLTTRRVRGWSLRPVFVDWNFVLISCRKNGETRYASVPRNQFERIGEHPERVLELRPSKRTLRNVRDATELAAWSGFDAAELDRQLERTSTKSKKKKKLPRGACTVTQLDTGEIEIGLPITMDPQAILSGKKQPPQHGAWEFGAGGDLHTGGGVSSVVDHAVVSRGMDFVFRRSYRSNIDFDCILGQNWDHNYNIRLVAHAPATAQPLPGTGWSERFPTTGGGGSVSYHHGTGRITEHPFKKWELRTVKWCHGQMTAVVSVYRQNDGDDFEIERYAVVSGALPDCVDDPIFYRIRVRGGLRILLNCNGHIVQMRDKNHNKMCFLYGAPLNPKTNYRVLRKIIDTTGRTHKLDYRVDASLIPRLKKLEDSFGRVVEFEYDPFEQLEKVKGVAPDRQHPQRDRPQLKYSYQRRTWGPQKTSLLKTITNPNEAQSGEAWLDNTYDAQLRITRQRVGSAGSSPRVGGTFRVRYPSATRVEVTDRMGVQTRYKLQVQADTPMVAERSLADRVSINGGTPTQRTLLTKYKYDANLHLERIEHPSGMIETFKFRNANAILRRGKDEQDSVGNFIHGNDLSRDDLLKATKTGGGVGFTTTQEWDPKFNTLKKLTSPVGTTTYRFRPVSRCAAAEYNGNPIEIIHPKQRNATGSLAVREVLKYSAGGLLNWHQDADGVISDISHAPDGQITIKKLGGVIVSSVQHDRFGNIHKVTDERGSTWTYICDERDRIVTATDPLSHQTTFKYDLNDQIRTVRSERKDDPTQIPGIPSVSALTREDSIDYDILGNRTRFTETRGGQTRIRSWKYDAEGRVSTIETPRIQEAQADAKSSFTYNARGLIERRTDGVGGPHEAYFESFYDLSSERALRRFQRGDTTAIHRDGLGRPTKKARSDGTEIHYEYSGYYLSRRYVVGNFDRGPGTTVQKRVLRDIRLRFDSHLREIRRAEMVYDPSRRTNTARNNGPAAVTKTWYTAGGKTARVDAPNRGSVVRKFDGSGRVDKITLPGGHEIKFGYDGHLVQTVTTTHVPHPGTAIQPPPAPVVVTETRHYDALGRITESTDGFGAKTRYAYDSTDNVRAEKKGNDLQVYQYDPFGRRNLHTIYNVRSDSNRAGTLTLRFEYDANDNRVFAWDGLNRRTLWKYDGRDRVVETREPGRDKITFEYYDDDRYHVVTEGTSRSTYDIDAAGRTTRVVHRDGNSRVEQRYGYSGVGEILWAADSNGTSNRDQVVVYRRYNSLGKMTRERTVVAGPAFDKTVTIGYPGPRRTETTYPAGSVIKHQFGADGLLTHVRSGNATILRRRHAGPGRPSEDRYTAQIRHQGQTYRARVSVEQTYDGQGRPDARYTLVSAPANGIPAFPFTTNERLGYSPETGSLAARTTGVVDAPPVIHNPTTLKLEKDGAGRLKDLHDPVQTTTFNLDAGNRIRGIKFRGLSVAMSYAAGRRVDTFPWNGATHTTTWSFDSRGRLSRSNTQTQVPYHGSLNARDKQYSFDPIGRLTHMRYRSIRISLGTADYMYDAFGRLVYRRAGPFSREVTNHFVYRGRRLLEEYDDSGRLQREYIYDDREKLVAFRFRERNRLRPVIPIVSLEGQPWLLLRHLARTTRNIPPPPPATASVDVRRRWFARNVNLVLEQHAYQPFQKSTPWNVPESPVISYQIVGNSVQASRGAGSVLPISVGGERAFGFEGLRYTHRRFYDPELGAFITPDPRGAWHEPRSLGNPYVSSGQDPSSQVDDGEGIWSVLAAVGLIMAIGGIGGALFGAARQLTLIADGKKKISDFSLKDCAYAAAIGALAAPFVVFVPEAVLPWMMIIGMATTALEFHDGRSGPLTLALDIIGLALLALGGYLAFSRPGACRFAGVLELAENLEETTALIRRRGLRTLIRQIRWSESLPRPELDNEYVVLTRFMNFTRPEFEIPNLERSHWFTQLRVKLMMLSKWYRLWRAAAHQLGYRQNSPFVSATANESDLVSTTSITVIRIVYQEGLDAMGPGQRQMVEGVEWAPHIGRFLVPARQVVRPVAEIAHWESEFLFFGRDLGHFYQPRSGRFNPYQYRARLENPF